MHTHTILIDPLSVLGLFGRKNTVSRRESYWGLWTCASYTALPWYVGHRRVPNEDHSLTYDQLEPGRADVGLRLDWLDNWKQHPQGLGFHGSPDTGA